MSFISLAGDRACGRALRPLSSPARGIAYGSNGMDPIEEAERVLAASADHRVLRRVPPIAEWRLTPAEGPTRRALFVDIKTTGPSIETDEVMAFGAILVEYDLRSGAIVEADKAVGFEDPAPRDIEALAHRAQLVIAHDAAFVRPMIEKLCPAFEQKNWASALAEIDWASEGLASVRVDDLLMRLGWFNSGLDVAAHAHAGAFLLSRRLPRSGALALRVLLSSARRPLMAVRAEGTMFEKREALKQRGYRWDAGGGGRDAGWWILTDAPQVEIAWLNAQIYQYPRPITPIPMPASRRYSARPWV